MNKKYQVGAKVIAIVDFFRVKNGTIGIVTKKYGIDDGRGGYLGWCFDVLFDDDTENGYLVEFRGVDSRSTADNFIKSYGE